MGFSPDRVDRMSLYQFAACVDGFNRANAPAGDKPDAPTDDEYRAAIATHVEI